MSKHFRDLLPELADGDENKYSLSTRMAAGPYQWILDFKSEQGFHTNSEAFRAILYFGIKYIPLIAAEEGINISERQKALSTAMEAKRVNAQRRDVQKTIIDLSIEAAENNDSVPMQLTLTNAAKGLADAFGFEYPPPDLPLTTTDLQANRVLEKVKSLLVSEDTNRITLNFLNQHTSLSASELKPILNKLQDAGLLTLQEEKRQGPPTIWIMIESVMSILGPYESNI